MMDLRILSARFLTMQTMRQNAVVNQENKTAVLQINAEVHKNSMFVRINRFMTDDICNLFDCSPVLLIPN